MEKKIKYFLVSLQQRPKYQWGFSVIKLFLKGLFLRGWERSNLEERGEFVFIVGCGRSGNTLLRRLLMENYSIYIPPETYVLGQQILRYGTLPKKWWSEKVDSVLSALEYHKEFKTFGVESLSQFSIEAKDWPEGKRDFYSLVDGLYRFFGNKAGYDTKWVGDKTPLNTLNLGIIQKAFPNAKFLYLERDPVDVVHSYLESGIYKSPTDAAKRWKKSVVAWDEFITLHGKNNCMEIKYEDLVRSPNKIISEVGRRFGMPVASDHDFESAKHLGDVEVYDHHSNVSNPPSEKSIGKGREKITEVILSEIRPIILNLAKKRGYEGF